MSSKPNKHELLVPCVEMEGGDHPHDTTNNSKEEEGAYDDSMPREKKRFYHLGTRRWRGKKKESYKQEPGTSRSQPSDYIKARVGLQRKGRRKESSFPSYEHPAPSTTEIGNNQEGQEGTSNLSGNVLPGAFSALGGDIAEEARQKGRLTPHPSQPSAARHHVGQENNMNQQATSSTPNLESSSEHRCREDTTSQEINMDLICSLAIEIFDRDLLRRQNLSSPNPSPARFGVSCAPGPNIIIGGNDENHGIREDEEEAKEEDNTSKTPNNGSARTCPYNLFAWCMIVLVCELLLSAILVTIYFLREEGPENEAAARESDKTSMIPWGDDQEQEYNFHTTVVPTTLSPTSSLSPSTSSPTFRRQSPAEAIRELLHPISGGLLDDPNEPQNKAFKWVAFKDTYFRNNGFWDSGQGPVPDEIKTPLIERYIMAVLYFSTDGNQSWEVCRREFLNRIRGTTSLCHWSDVDSCDFNTGLVAGLFEIYCDETETSIDWIVIDESGLSGSLPSEIGFLTNLSVLNIANNNQLEGTIPNLGQLTKLTDLRLFGNSLEGEIPSTTGLLTALTYLDLVGNNLMGEVPTELGSLTALSHLDLAENYLLGEVPTELGRLTSLQELFLNDNHLTGLAPSSSFQSNLTNLEYAWFHGNDFSGGNFSTFCDNPNSRLQSLRADCLVVECSCCVLCCTSTLLCS